MCILSYMYDFQLVNLIKVVIWDMHVNGYDSQ